MIIIYDYKIYDYNMIIIDLYFRDNMIHQDNVK